MTGSTQKYFHSFEVLVFLSMFKNKLPSKTSIVLPRIMVKTLWSVVWQISAVELQTKYKSLTRYLYRAFILWKTFALSLFARQTIAAITLFLSLIVKLRLT